MFSLNCFICGFVYYENSQQDSMQNMVLINYMVTHNMLRTHEEKHYHDTEIDSTNNTLFIFITRVSSATYCRIMLYYMVTQIYVRTQVVISVI